MVAPTDAFTALACNLAPQIAWDEPTLRSMVVKMLAHHNIGALDLIRAWDQNKDGQLTEAEFISHIEPFFREVCVCTSIVTVYAPPLLLPVHTPCYCLCYKLAHLPGALHACPPPTYTCAATPSGRARISTPSLTAPTSCLLPTSVFPFHAPPIGRPAPSALAMLVPSPHPPQARSTKLWAEVEPIAKRAFELMARASGESRVVGAQLSATELERWLRKDANGDDAPPPLKAKRAKGRRVTHANDVGNLPRVTSNRALVRASADEAGGAAEVSHATASYHVLTDPRESTADIISVLANAVLAAADRDNAARVRELDAESERLRQRRERNQHELRTAPHELKAYRNGAFLASP